MSGPGINIKIVPDEAGGFSVEFQNNDGTEIWAAVGGFPTHEAANEFVTNYMVKLIVAMRPLN